MTFLNLEKKLFIIGDVELPVRENVKGAELKPLRDMQREIIKNKGELTDIDDLEYELKFFDTVSNIAFNLGYEELLEKISEPEARELLGEAYIFLTKIGTITKAKQLDNVLAEISDKSKKLSTSTQN